MEPAREDCHSDGLGAQPVAQARATLDGLLAALIGTEALAATSSLASSWEALADTRPDMRCAGRLFALAGAFLWSKPCVASGDGESAARKGPAADSAVRTHASLAVAGEPQPLRVLAAWSPPDDDVSQARQQEAAAGLFQQAPWAAASGRARAAAARCVALWAAALRPRATETCRQEGGDDVAAALAQFLPAAVTCLRAEAAESSPRRGPASVIDATTTRRALIVVLSMHWMMEHLHYTAMRDRFGVCLPPLLQVLDTCTDKYVRFVGLDTLRLTLDRAMAAEVQNFVPPLAHCLAIASPLFMDGDGVAESTVAPYCACHVLFLMKGYGAAASSQRQEILDKFMAFGSVHCRGRTRAFRLFLEFGLVPLLCKEVWLLRTRLKLVLEMLLQATESINCVEALLAWEALTFLLQDPLARGRLRRYTMDVLLRAALAHMSFLDTDPPPQLLPDGEAVGVDKCNFISPVVAAMTASEWALVKRHASALRRALERVISLLAASDAPGVQRLLCELEGSLSPGDATTPLAAPQLKSFAAFARAAIREAAAAAAHGGSEDEAVSADGFVIASTEGELAADSELASGDAKRVGGA